MGQMVKAIRASRNLGLHVMPTFSGTLLWHTMYPWPQRPAGLVELGFSELAKRWQPLLNFESGEPARGGYPTVYDGLRGMRFITNVVESSQKGGAWVYF